MERKGFFCYNSFLDAMEPLNDAERGRLFTQCLQYSIGGADGRLSGNERFLWPMIKSQMDRDFEKADRLSEVRAASRKSKKQLITNDNICEENEELHTKDKDKNKNKNTTPYTPQGVEDTFSRFWSAYPKKVGKKKAQESFAKLRPDDKTLQAMLASLEYQKQSDQWRRDGGQYIPHPVTWLNQRRWEDEDAQPPAPPKKRRPVFDREYTLEERLNGANPVVVGWEDGE